MPSHGGALRILHLFRAPVGGLFRHVLDLARAQAARGHQVGFVADSTTGGERAEAAFRDIAPHLALGIERIAMSRAPGIGDVSAALRAGVHARAIGAHVVHGHGAKGGLYARLAHIDALKAYTPHGGSLNYSKWSPAGFVYLGCESLLRLRTDVFLFESAYAQATFRSKIGPPRGVARVVHNGIGPAEFEPVRPAADARDLVFVGEFADRKGIDLLLQALARLNRQGVRLTLAAVGAGPAEAALRALAERLDLAGQIRFLPAQPARQAFAMGRVLVVPSRAESLPYIVLEGVAAGLPIVATNVGGVPEIFGPWSHALVPPEDVGALAEAITADAEARAAISRKVHERILAGFSTEAMCDGVLAAYQDGLNFRQSA
ncbi:MAG TPA: glycosyltransferase family 4 protein [Xanthobacteraceae bacterium]|nr:glycosyltransferase family 4 protein [Xanthobacteraceae bacterium]